MIKKILALTVLILSFQTTNLFSQEQRLSLNFGLGPVFYQNNQNINANGSIQNVYAGYINSLSFEAGVGYRFGKRFYLRESIWLTEGTTNNMKLTIGGLHTTMRYNFISFEKSRITPYIQLGLNLNSISLNSSASTRKVLSGADTLTLTDSSQNVSIGSLEFAPAIGIDFKLSNRIILFAEAKYHINPFSNPNTIKAVFPDNIGKLNYTSVSVGVRINLGRTKKSNIIDTSSTSSREREINGPIIKLTMVDSELPLLLDADIQMEDTLKYPSFKKMVLKERTGRFAFKLENGENYKFIVKKKYYEDTYFNIDLSEDVNTPEFEKTVTLKPKKKQYLLDVFDSENLEFMSVNLEINNKDLDENISASLTRDNKYAINLREGSRYNVEVKSSAGRFFYTDEIFVSDSLGFKSATVMMTQTVKMPVQKIKIGKSLLLKDIFYKYNSDELIETSFAELNRVVELLKVNPSLTIEIAAHTDETGSADYNMSLSNKRAKFVSDYIIKNGIDAKRLTPKGYGKTKPISPNDTEANRQKNRRLELKVLKYKP